MAAAIRCSGVRAFALIELLVVVAIILILAGLYFTHNKGKGHAQKTTPGQAIEKANSVACQSNLRQIRESLQMDVDSGEPLPKRIDQGPLAALDRCPVSGKPYVYNPQTGQVYCQTPGHEKY